MADPKRSAVSRLSTNMAGALRDGWRVLLRRGPSQVQFWLIALVIGIVAGFFAVYFRIAVIELQSWIYGTNDPSSLPSLDQGLQWGWVLAIPICGGLVVGLILQFFTRDSRSRAVADVIEGAALNNGRVERREGIASAIASLITLSTGGSTGREGPVVHFAAVISSWISDRIRADGITGRDLLGCAVAAAVSASFNAPIAGALFALEVVLRHFAIRAFAPIVIASVAGTVISRLTFGDVTEFVLPTDNALEFYVELPAFLILGLICGVVAVLLMRSIFWADDFGNFVQRTIRLPRFLRPALAGALLGGLAIYYPHIIGVGYETTSAALTGELLLWEAVVFALLKTIAVAITIAGRMAGGVFSPSLMLGALTGLAFGLIATAVLPEVSGSETLYALAGMGAVAAAVFGAPISTTLIVFEMTGDWQTGLAVMVAVSMSTAVSSHLVARSYFLTQLKRRGVHLAPGPQAYLLSTLRCDREMRPLADLNAAEVAACRDLMGRGVYLVENGTLEAALPLFEAAETPFIPVVAALNDDQTLVLRGALFQVDALKAFSRALSITAAEEHA